MTKDIEKSPFNRVCWIDNAKAIGILLIMLGHTKGGLGHEAVLHSFRMPLFFFLAGYLLKREYLQRDLLSFAKRLYYRLVIPYVFFWVISWLYWLPTQWMAGLTPRHSSLYALLMGLLYGINDSLYPNVVLWFFTCLFMTSLLFFIVHRFVKERLLLPLAVALALITAFVLNNPTIRLPWNIDIAFVVLFFFALGYFAREYKLINKLIHNTRAYNIVGFLLCSVALYSIAEYNGRVYLSSMVFGNPILFFVTAVLGIVTMVYISHLLPRKECFEWISKNTITLFCLHQLFYSIFTGIGVVVFRLSYNFNTSLIINIVYLVSATLLCIPSSMFFKRYCPWAVGELKTKVCSN